MQSCCRRVGFHRYFNRKLWDCVSVVRVGMVVSRYCRSSPMCLSDSSCLTSERNDAVTHFYCRGRRWSTPGRLSVVTASCCNARSFRKKEALSRNTPLWFHVEIQQELHCRLRERRGVALISTRQRQHHRYHHRAFKDRKLHHAALPLMSTR